MKNFIIKIIRDFILPIMAFVCLIEFILSALPTSYSVKRDLIENNKNSIEVYLTGTSHIFSGLNPKYLDWSAVNIANNSQSLYYDIEILEKYLDQLSSLKIIVFEVNIFTFLYNLDLGPEPWRRKYYYSYFGIPPETVNESIFEKFHFLNYRPTDIVNLIKNFANYNAYYSSKGWAKQTIQSKGISESMITYKYREITDEYMNSSHPAHILSRFEELLAELKNKNVQVILINPPIYEGLYEKFSTYEVERTMTIIHDLCHKFNIEFLDYSNTKSFIASDFVDTDHLTQKASTRFTNLFNQDLMKLHSKTKKVDHHRY